MVEIKDTQLEEKEKKDKEQQQEKKQSWFTKVPMLWKILGVLLILVQYMRIQSQGKDINEIWFWIVIVFVIWLMFGTGSNQKENEILTPAEADECFDKEIQRLRRANDIPLSTQIYPGINKGLQWTEGMPTHYLKEFSIRGMNGNFEYKRATINAQGNTKGYVTFQDALGKLTGRETTTVISKFPPWAKRLKDVDMLDKFLFTGEKKTT